MLPHHVALVRDTNQVTTSDFLRASDALQTQVARDFAPIWGIEATVSAFDNLATVPSGYWPIIVLDNVSGQAQGFHKAPNGQPTSFVRYSDHWSAVASHECLEMLADPTGNQTVPGLSVKNDGSVVTYLMEVCDPCGTSMYLVNGVKVSDFYTRHFFDSASQTSIQYSFTGAIKGPLQLLPGGYITFQDPKNGGWWQAVQTNASSSLQFRRLSGGGKQSLRERLGSQRPDNIAPPAEVLANLRALAEAENRAGAARAKTLEGWIRTLDRNARP